MSTQPETISALLSEAGERLARNGQETPQLDARLLLQFATGKDHAGIISAGSTTVDARTRHMFLNLLEQRLAGKSVHRIVGFREFYGHNFIVSNETLEPRPDTEMLIDEVKRDLSNVDEVLHFADIGTGSGILAISLLIWFANATALATDLSKGALKTAEKNSRLLNVDERLKLVATSYLEGVTGRFDFLVSNPPYIPTSVIETLEATVREHDPLLALDGGSDGLAAYRVILENGKRVLKQNGRIYLEIGYDQEGDLRSLGEFYGWNFIRSGRDLNGNWRTIVFEN